MAELTERLKERGREIIKICLMLLILLLTAPTLVEAGSVGWEQGLIHSGASALASLLPGNIDIPVVILAGMISAWLLFFAIDSTKRIQTLLLLPVVGLVYVYLGEFEHVVDAMARQPVPFVTSLLFTLLVTGALTGEFRVNKTIRNHSTIDLLRLIQFPRAAYWMYSTLAAVILVITFQYPFMSRTQSDPSSLSVILAGMLSLVALSIFVKYTDERDIVSIAPTGSTGRKTTVYLITGMYFEAKDKFNGIPPNKQSEKLLEKAINQQSEMMKQGFYSSVSFRYLPPNLLSRAVIVETENRTTADVNMQAVRRLAEDTMFRLTHYLRGVGRGILPESVKTYAASNTMLTRIVEVDVLLLVVPLSENSDERSIGKMAELMRILSEDTRTGVRLVITHADRAESSNNQLNYQDNFDRDVVLKKVQEAVEAEETEDALQYVRRNLIDQVHPVSGDIEPGELRGFDALLRNL